MATSLDSRQSIVRGVLQHLLPYASAQTVELILKSVDADTTSVLEVTASNPASLVINVGGAIVNNSFSERNKSITFINNAIPTFTGGTITFPASSGGNIVASTGGTTVLTLPSGDYARILIALDTNGNLLTSVGTPNATQSLATLPSPQPNTLPFCYVVLFNSAGTIQNVAQSSVYQLIGGGGAGGSGSGSGKNYLTQYIASTSSGVANPGNGNFESGSTAGWSLAHVAFSVATGTFLPTGTATAGTAFSSTNGGSAASGNLSLSVISLGQLAGLYSGSLVSSAANTQGDLLISNAFFIDLEDKAKPLTFSFYYEFASGASNLNLSGTTSNTFGVWIYDVTNAQWIQPAGCFNIVQGTGAGYCVGTFQTSVNSTQYQLAVMQPNVGSGAFTMYIDDFNVSPQTAPIGAAVSDWQQYTMTIGSIGGTPPTKGGVVYDLAEWRRVGDSMEIRYIYFQNSAGSAGTGTYLFPLPPGYSIDTTKLSPDTTALYGIGLATNTDSSNANSTGWVGYWNTTTLQVQAANSSHSITNLGAGGPGALNNTMVEFAFHATIPIVGWSSNTSMSSDTDTRVVAARYHATASTSVPTSTNTIINFDTKDIDTHGAVTTGASWAFKCPVSGVYRVSAYVEAVDGDFNQGNEWILTVLKNGGNYCQLMDVVAQNTFVNAQPGAGGSDLIQCNAGDILALEITQTTGVTQSSSANSNKSHVAIERLSGPAVVAASESINARYNTSTSTLGIGLSSIVYTNKNFDSHDAYNTTSGLYTIPVSGKYQVNASLEAAATFSVNESIDIRFHKNGGDYSSNIVFAGGTEANLQATLSDIIDFVAGDTIVVQVSCSGSSPSIAPINFRNYFSIARVGN